MKYKITFTEKDFVTFQLFNASQSSTLKRKRLRNWILFVLISVLLGFLFRDKGNDFNDFLSIYFFGFSLVTLLVYPFYSRWQYKKHYIKYIKEHYKERLGKTNEIEITPTFIWMRDGLNESKISTTEITYIHEIKDYIFVKIKNGNTIILPIYSIENVQELKTQLLEICHKFDRDYEINLNWKWR